MTEPSLPVSRRCDDGDGPSDSGGWERPPCDVTECGRLADWAYIGEGGDLYLCLLHASEETAGWQWIGER